MAELLRMPEVAANTASAILAAWPIDTNVEYRANDSIVTVETDKAVVDVEAETDGVILKTLVDAGANVEVGAPIAVVGKPGEQVTDLDALLKQLGVTNANPAGAPAAAKTPGTPSAAPPTVTSPTPNTAMNGDHGNVPGRTFASPLARRIARNNGLTLNDITGSGPHGRIVRADVEAAIANHTRPPTPITTQPASAAHEARPSQRPQQTPPTAPAAAYDDIPNSRLRTAIAGRLSASKQTIPHFYLRGSADVTALLALRKQLNDAAAIKISVNDLIVKAVAKAHVLVPDVNAIWTGDKIRQFHAVDIAVAITTPTGLVTPVLRHVDQMSITAVAQATQDVAQRAREGQLRQHELEGGSTTISNLGMFGTEEFSAIINPPQSTILAVGAARPEAVVREGQIHVATILRATVSIDHRVIDGALAAKWMQTLVQVLENPLSIII